MSSNRTNSGHVLRAVEELTGKIKTNNEVYTLLLNNLTDEVATLKDTVDSVLPNSTEEANMADSAPQTPIDLSSILPQLQALTVPQQQQAMPDFEAMVNKALDSKMDAVVDKVMEAQESNKSFWTSPVFLGCVAGGTLLLIGGTLYYLNQRVNNLEELNVK